MKFFCAFFAVAVAATQAKPSGVAAPLLAPVVPVAVSAPVSTQYHAQDEAGQYTYGYSNPLSSKTEVKSIDGITRGAYNYIDAEGKLQSVEYSSDAQHGFRVAASNLPIAPTLPEVPVLIGPEPVKDTPEVFEARARHLVALKEAETRAAEEPATVVAKTEAVVPTVRLAEASSVAPSFASFAFLPGVIPTSNLAAVRLGTPVVSYNYGIPGAAVTYSAYSAPVLTAYTSQIAAPIWAGAAVPFGADAITVEAKTAKAEAKEKSD